MTYFVISTILDVLRSIETALNFAVMNFIPVICELSNSNNNNEDTFDYRQLSSHYRQC